MDETKNFANELDGSFVNKLVQEGKANVIGINPNINASTNSGTLLFYRLNNSLYLPNYNNSEFYKVEFMEIETNGKIQDDCKLEITVIRNDEKYEKVSIEHLSQKDTATKLKNLSELIPVEIYNKATSTKPKTHSIIQEAIQQPPPRPVRKNAQNPATTATIETETADLTSDKTTKIIGKPEDYDLVNNNQVFEENPVVLPPNETNPAILPPNEEKAEEEKQEMPVPSTEVNKKPEKKEEKAKSKSDIKLWKNGLKDFTTNSVFVAGWPIAALSLTGALTPYLAPLLIVAGPLAPLIVPAMLVLGILMIGFSGNIVEALEKNIKAFVAFRKELKQYKKEYKQMQEANPENVLRKKTRKEKRTEKKAEKLENKQAKKAEKLEKRKQMISKNNPQNTVIDDKYKDLPEDEQQFQREYDKAHHINQTQEKNKPKQKRGDTILAGENEDTLQRMYVDKGLNTGIYKDAKTGYFKIGMPQEANEYKDPNKDPENYEEYFDKEIAEKKKAAQTKPTRSIAPSSKDMGGQSM